MSVPKTLPILLLLAAGLCQGLEFTSPPALVRLGGGGWSVAFGISQAADVEVSIVDTVLGRVVRHLAAGALGPKASAPFMTDSLRQEIAWDGTDDAGHAAADPGACAARVRAGMGASLAGMAGENPYVFYRGVRGVVMDSAGGFYVFGPFPWLAHHGTSGMTLRKYNRDGAYEKTLWPVPAGLNPGSLSPYGIVRTPEGGYFPGTEAMDAPQLGGSPLTYENSFLCRQTVNGRIMVLDYPSLRYQLINLDGTPASEGNLVTSPALPSASSATRMSGPMYLTLSPDRSFFLLSGCYQLDAAGFPSSTGFWREGQVFKVDAATGAATVFISVPADSLPADDASRRAAVGPRPSGSLGYMAVFHGTAFDDSGRVFICDRLRDEVGVYDNTGARLGAISVADPDQVAVNPKTGAVYVLCRTLSLTFNNSYPPVYASGTRTLWKFAGWTDASGQSISLRKGSALGKQAMVMDMEKTAGLTCGRLNMALDTSGGRSIIRVNGAGGPFYASDTSLSGLRTLEDIGDTMVVVHDFRNLARGGCTGFDRIAVDRALNRVYVNNSWNELYKIEDWANPVFSKCSTSAGQPLPATDAAIGPDGLLYVHEGLGQGPIKRYTQDRLHAPANVGATGSNTIVARTSFGYGGGTQDKGIAVSWDGKVYAYNGSYLAAKLQQYDSTGTLTRDNVVGLGCPAGGLKVDPSGMVYLSASLRQPSQIIPPAYSSYWPVIWSSGSVVKFHPDSGGAFGNTGDADPDNRTVSKAMKVYDIGISPFSGSIHGSVSVPSASWACVCRTPRFDVDPYGRIFAPHTVIGRVTVADNAGNEIMAFGEYGNADSRGPGIPLAWPAGVGTSEDYIYVTDLVNARLVRVRMDYALDNRPGFTDRLARTPPVVAVPRMTVAPNPFNGRVTITVAGGEGRMAIYRLDGRKVLDLKPGAQAVWDGRDASNRHVPNGVYLCRYESAHGRLAARISYLR